MGKSLNWRRARTAGIVVILTTIIVLVAQSQTLIDAQFSPQPQPAAKEAGVPANPQTTKGKDRPDPEGESSVVVPKGTPANVAPRVTTPAEPSTDLPNANFNETNPPANNNTPAGTSRKLLETLRKKGDLSLRDASLRQALFAISENWQVSIVVGPDIDGKVDGSFHDAPLFEILDSILTVNGFGYRATGNNLVVGRLEALAGENPLFETAILELASANPDDLINLARPQSSLQGRLEAFGNGGLLVADYPDNIAKIRKLARQFDQSAPARPAKAAVGAEASQANSANNSAASLLGGSGVGVAQFQLKHNNAALLAEPIKTILTRDGKVTVMESENRLVVVDHPHAIETIQKLVSELDAPGSGLRVVQFAPSHLRVASLTEAIRSLLSKDGRININDAENRLIVIDYPHIIRKVETLFQDADTPRNGLRSIDLRAQNTDAKDLQNAVASLLSKDGKVALVDNENRLVISDYPANLERIEDMFRQLDTARSQVRITALIYDMSTEDIYRLGLNWNHSLKDNHNAAGAPQTGFSIDSLMQVPQAAGSPASVITLWNLNRAFDIRAVIDAMNNCTDSRLLADPSVVVVDRKTAQFKIVTEVPLQQLTQTGQTNIGTTQFKEAGVVLKVTPRIANDATIEMQLTPTFSRLAGYTPGAAPQPIFDRREADTTVRIANQQVFVVGGLRQRNEINQNRGIPGLKDIKKFQFHRLWSSEGREFRESELIVFVSPELVTPCYNGRPREQHAGEQGFQMLDEVPAFGGAQIHGSMPGPMQPGEHVLPYPPSARPTYDVLPHDELPRPQQQGPPPAGPTSNQSTQAKSAPKLTAPANDLRTATPALPAAKKPTSSSSAANKPTTTNPKVSPPNSSAVSAIPSVAAPRTVAPVALYQDELPLPNSSEPKYDARVDESPVAETQVSPAAESSYSAKSEKPKSPAATQAAGSSWKNPFAAKPSSSATPASTTPRPKPSAMQTPSLVPSQNQPSRSSSFLPPPLPTSNTYQPASNTAVKSPEPSLVPTGEYFRR